MTLPIGTIPENAVTQNHDKGRRVTINSCGGALKDWPGVVVCGPYQFTMKLKSSVNAHGNKYKKDKKGRIKTIDTTFVSAPYWCVLLDKYDLYVSFGSTEITFV